MVTSCGAGIGEFSIFIPIPRPKKRNPKQLAFETEWTADRIQENAFINKVRGRVLGASQALAFILQFAASFVVTWALSNEGPIFPVNPKGTPILGYKAYTSVLEIPDPVDLVNISVKAALIPDVIAECGKKGVKFCIVHSAGFKEVGAEGIERERLMVERAHEYGMRVFGPNSQGIQNSDPEISVYANFTFVPMKPRHSLSTRPTETGCSFRRRMAPGT